VSFYECRCPAYHILAIITTHNHYRFHSTILHSNTHLYTTNKPLHNAHTHTHTSLLVRPPLYRPLPA
jgi:hypothetical protein